MKEQPEPIESFFAASLRNVDGLVGRCGRLQEEEKGCIANLGKKIGCIL
jgi:hypothetical protein